MSSCLDAWLIGSVVRILSRQVLAGGMIECVNWLLLQGCPFSLSFSGSSNAGPPPKEANQGPRAPPKEANQGPRGPQGGAKDRLLSLSKVWPPWATLGPFPR